MSRPSRRMPNLGKRDAERGDMAYRNLQIRASTLDIESRTIEATVSTETPVLMPDWQRGEMVPEVLQSKGAIIPDSRQVPFLDSHNRSRVSDQLGSARDVGVKYNDLKARLHFSEAASSEFTKVREGHVTDVSAGYEVLKRVYVAKGETKEVNGRSYKGPVNVVTQWRLREVSLTPIGADAQAKLRGLDPEMVRFLVPGDERFEMNPKLRALLVSRGMDAGLSDDEAQQWAVDNEAKLAEKREEPTFDIKDVGKFVADEVRKAMSGFDIKDVGKHVAEETRKAIAAEQQRVAAFRAEVDSLCGLADLPDQAEHCRGLADIAAVRKHLADEKAKRVESIGYSPSIRQTGSGQARLLEDMGTALTMRAMGEASHNVKTHEKVFPVEQRGKGAERFRYATPFQMAEEYVRSCGLDTMGLSREQVAICAMFGPEKAGIRSNPAYHTTGSFTNLTLDAMNKSMAVGYTEAPSTWRGPMRQAASVADFKNKHTIRMGAIPNLPIWNDNTNPNQASFNDAREVYAVESRSLEITYSYRLLVNDDMDALSRTPGMLGAAAARTLNAYMWSLITSNPTMSDGKALFLETPAGNRMRSNLTTGSAAPTVATIQTLTNKMRQMRGENVNAGTGQTETESADILNLQPVYLAGPGALETTIMQLLRSIADPAASQAGVHNPTSYLQPIIEPLLDVASTTAFYLFAGTNQIDTVEVSFLQGQESPITRSDLDYKTLAQSVIVLHTYGGKAMNHRGMQKHDGA